jgi:hypothetical protein
VHVVLSLVGIGSGFIVLFGLLTRKSSALIYLATGEALLAEDCWERRYALTFGLAFHGDECEYLTGNLAAAEERLSILSRRAAGLVDRASVTCLRVVLYTTMDRPDRSVEICLEYLRDAGIEWSLTRLTRKSSRNMSACGSRSGADRSRHSSTCR